MHPKFSDRFVTNWTNRSYSLMNSILMSYQIALLTETFVTICALTFFLCFQPRWSTLICTAHVLWKLKFLSHMGQANVISWSPGSISTGLNSSYSGCLSCLWRFTAPGVSKVFEQKPQEMRLPLFLLAFFFLLFCLPTFSSYLSTSASMGGCIAF